MKKNIFAKHESKLPREVVESQSLHILTNELDKAFRNLIQVGLAG